MSCVMITGSLGYIGSVLTDYLTERGHVCRGCDTGFFEQALIYPISIVNENTIKKDARDLAEADLEGIDTLIHLAGISNDPVGNLDPASVYDPTREYSLRIARLCKQLDIRFIFVSSCSVYGMGDCTFLNEDAPTNPQTYYSHNKLQIEQDLACISDDKFSPVILRFATVFGLSPRMRFDIVINMLGGMALSSGKVVLNSDGRAWRPNLHILDACEAIRCAIELKYNRPEPLVLNIGSDENNLQVIQIAELICAEIPGSEIVFLRENPTLDREGLIRDRKINRDVDRRTYRVSFEKAHHEMPELKIEWTVQEGIRKMIVDLRKIIFDAEVFRNRGFYRLQRLEDLYKQRMITSDLRWS